MESIVVIRSQESDLSKYYTRSQKVLDHMKDLLEGKINFQIDDFETSSGRMKKLQKIEPLYMKKNALIDVSNSDVKKSWIDRATSYIKTKYREFKEKFSGEKEEER